MGNTPDILKKILSRKVQEVVQRSEKLSLKDLSKQVVSAPETRAFEQALKHKVDNHKSAVIAEIKKASPSKGLIREHFDPQQIAISYALHGAACLSVLTDQDFFQGEDQYLRIARAATNLPVLRKDFIVDVYQIYEARVLGADCILLIVAALGDAQLLEFAQLSWHLGMDVLIEVHDYEELQRALQIGPSMIGINNRNLRTFEVRLQTSIELLEFIPDDVTVISESAIHTRKDIQTLRSSGIQAFLVGEAFMRADDPGEELARLFGD